MRDEESTARGRLEQIRELLLGESLRDVEARLDRLQDRLAAVEVSVRDVAAGLARESSAVRTEMTSRRDLSRILMEMAGRLEQALETRGEDA